MLCRERHVWLAWRHVTHEWRHYTSWLLTIFRISCQFLSTAVGCVATDLFSLSRHSHRHRSMIPRRNYDPYVSTLRPSSRPNLTDRCGGNAVDGEIPLPNSNYPTKLCLFLGIYSLVSCPEILRKPFRCPLDDHPPLKVLWLDGRTLGCTRVGRVLFRWYLAVYLRTGYGTLKLRQAESQSSLFEETLT